MSVDFGTIRTGMFGFTPALTKRIRKQGFRVDSALDIARIQAVIRATCTAYPPAKRKWGSTYVTDPDGDFRPRITRTDRFSNMISYGSGSVREDGTERVSSIRWGLVLTEGKQLKLADAQLTNGRISAITEMERFLNELEQNLQLQDPSASISMG
jgi:hypothetical protein